MPMKPAEEILAIAATVEQTPEVMLAVEAQKTLLLRGKVPDDKLFDDAVKFIEVLSMAVVVGAKVREDQR
jgi:CO dehydrogenase/acetyl-CoA synthase epsilon subunit